MKKSKSRKRATGKKTILPSRIPGLMKLPILPAQMVNEEVFAALEVAGWTRPANTSDALFDKVMAEHEISRSIRQCVAYYVAARCQAQDPKKFRAQLADFTRAVATLAEAMPSDGSAVYAAVSEELENISPNDDQLSFSALKMNLKRVHQACEHLTKKESGPGIDGDRPAHELISGLAHIFEHHTKRRAKRGYDPETDDIRGPFANFIKAVNSQIPEGFHLLGDIDNLIRHYVANANHDG